MRIDDFVDVELGKHAALRGLPQRSRMWLVVEQRRHCCRESSWIARRNDQARDPMLVHVRHPRFEIRCNHWAAGGHCLQLHHAERLAGRDRGKHQQARALVHRAQTVVGDGSQKSHSFRDA